MERRYIDIDNLYFKNVNYVIVKNIPCTHRISLCFIPRIQARSPYALAHVPSSPIANQPNT